MNEIAAVVAYAIVGGIVAAVFYIYVWWPTIPERTKPDEVGALTAIALLWPAVAIFLCGCIAFDLMLKIARRTKWT